MIFVGHSKRKGQATAAETQKPAQAPGGYASAEPVPPPIPKGGGTGSSLTTEDATQIAWPTQVPLTIPVKRPTASAHGRVETVNLNEPTWSSTYEGGGGCRYGRAKVESD